MVSTSGSYGECTVEPQSAQTSTSAYSTSIVSGEYPVKKPTTTVVVSVHPQVQECILFICVEFKLLGFLSLNPEG
jgi:hypothetical protein